MAIARYDPYTDSFIHEGNDESITATISIDSMPKNIIQMNVVELSSECIDKIADAVVKKLKAEQTEPNSKVSETPTSSEIPNNCETCLYAGECDREPWQECPYEPKDEPQTVLEAVLYRQTDEDRRKMEESVRKAIKDEPQTERKNLCGKQICDHLFDDDCALKTDCAWK